MSQGTTSSDGGGTAVNRGVGFWLAYLAGWLLYSGLVLSAEQMEGADVVGSLSAVAVVTLPAMGFGAIVAALRRDFFRPDRSLLRMALLHLGTGAVYAVACATVSGLLARTFDVRADGEIVVHAGPTVILSYGFLYVLLASFLMWTESIARVQESRAAIAREAMLRAQAEATAIRAQFNPHFVFNVLHSLILLVRAEPDRAERAIEDVAALIRYATRLQREERDVVPLEEEVGFARRYLALETLRLEERLRVEWAVDPTLGRTPVPSFGLQTLLENAVKHGIAPRPEGGRIRVSAHRDGGSVVLAVEDDGPGATDAEVTAGGGRGLRLLRDRVRMLHGAAGRVSWGPGEVGGFRTEIRVPAP